MGSAISNTATTVAKKNTPRSNTYTMASSTTRSATFDAQSIANPGSSLDALNVIISSIESAPASTNIKQSPSKRKLSRRVMNSSMKKQYTDKDFCTIEKEPITKEGTLPSLTDLKTLMTKSPTLKRYCNSFAKTQISLTPMPIPTGLDMESVISDDLSSNCESMVTSYRSHSTSHSSILSSNQSSPNFNASMLKRMEMDTYICYKQRSAGTEVKDLKTYHFP